MTSNAAAFESLHPRNTGDGTFAAKTLSVPEVKLDSEWDAYDEWAQSLDLPSGIMEDLWNGTDYNKSAAFNIRVIQQNAGRMGVDFDALGLPIPVVQGSAETAASDGPVGYTYKAENYTPAALVALMVGNGELSPAARDMDPEEVLDQHAGANGIDREDEHTFDSDDFPKAILESMVTIHEHEFLGREYWDFGDFTANGPQTADAALDEWVSTYEGLDSEALTASTNVTLTAEENIALIRSAAAELNLDLDAAGYPLPTRYN